MKLVRLRAPGGLENLKLVEEDHPKPRPDELLVRIRARSLNFHDDMVVLGKIPCADGRIPLSDGAGEVIAVAGRRNERPLPGGIYLEITAVFRWKKSSLPSSISNPKSTLAPGFSMEDFSTRPSDIGVHASGIHVIRA